MTDHKKGPPGAITPRAQRAHLWGRRDWLTRLGWASILGSLTAGSGAFVRLLFRRAPVEPPTIARAGRASDFQPGSVSDRLLKAWRVFIVREEDRVFAIHARCTHLGCTPRWYGRESKFKCPCHGSGFTPAGVNFEGPAPSPLERAAVWMDRGTLWVDVSKRFGEEDWEQEAARVVVGAGPARDEGDA